MPGFDAVFLRWLLLSSASATAIAGVVVVVQIAFDRWLTPAGRQRLWLLVVVRLLLPILPASGMSIANLRIENILTTRHAEMPVVSPAKDPLGFVTTIRIKPMSTGLIPPASMPVAADIAAPRSWVDVMPAIAVALWATVALSILSRLLWVNRALSFQLHRATPVNDIATLELLRECLAIGGVRRSVTIVETDAVATPAVHGIIRPRILMPAGLLESLTCTQRRHIILHELSHIRHHDVLANWVLALLSIIHWFNPLLWIAFARLKADRELARDAWVVRRGEAIDSADNYAETLIDLAQRLSVSRSASWPQVAAPLPGLFGRKTSLRRRLQMIAHQSNPSRVSQLIGIILVAIVAAGTLTRARAQTSSVGDTPAVTQPDHSTATRPSSYSRDTNQLIRQTQEQINAGRFSAALDTVQQILVVDPKNDYAVGVKPLLEDKVKYSAAVSHLTTEKPVLPWTIDRFVKEVQTAIAERRYDDALRSVDSIQKTDPANQFAAGIRPLLLTKVQSEPDADLNRVRILNRVLPTVQFDAVGFNDVIDFLRDISGANIFVNWKVLEAAGIDRNTPVTANIHNVKFSKALDLIVDCVSAGKVKVRYTFESGVITISTKEDLQKNVVIAVYDIRDLLDTAPGDREGRDKKIAALTKLIEDSVDSETWKDRGGSVASLRVFDPSGQLIVTQTPENHKALIEVLDRMRAHRQVQIVLEGEYYDCDSGQLAIELKKWWTPNAQKPPTTQEASAGVVLTREQVEQHLNKFKDSGAATLIASPRFMLLDGQQALVQTSIKRTYVGDYTAIHGADGQVRYEPVQRTVEPGVEIDAQASVIEGQDVVKLSMHPKLTTLTGMISKPWPGRPEGFGLSVETPQLNVSEAQVSALVPSEQVLVTVVAQQERGRSLLILVKPTIVRQQAAPQKQFPALKAIFGQEQRSDAQPPLKNLVGMPQGTVDLSSHYPWMKN